MNAAVSLGARDMQFLAQPPFLLVGPFDGGTETVCVEHAVGSQPFDESVDFVVVADPRDHPIECLVALRWDESLSPAHNGEPLPPRTGNPEKGRQSALVFQRILRYGSAHWGLIHAKRVS